MRWIALLLAPIAVGVSASPVPAPVPFGGEALDRLADGFEVTLNATWSPDGSQMLFSRAMKDWSRIELRVAEIRNGRIGAIGALPFADSAARDVDPFISPDGRTVYFASDRSLPGDTGARAYHLWKADRLGASWGPARPLAGEAGTLGPLLYPSIDRDGMLVFTRTTAEGPRLYRAKMKGDAILDAAPLDIPGVTLALDATVAGDGRAIVFVAPVEAGSRVRAIYRTRRAGEGWSAPQIVYRPEAPAVGVLATGLSRDGRTLYFTSKLPAAGSGSTSGLFSLKLPD